MNYAKLTVRAIENLFEKIMENRKTDFYTAKGYLFGVIADLFQSQN